MGLRSGFSVLSHNELHSGKADEDIKLETRFQDELRDRGIPIPVIYPNKEAKEFSDVDIGGKRWQAILMAFVEGDSVTVHPSHELIAELATLQAKMHLFGMEFAKEADGPKSVWTELRDTMADKLQKIPVDNPEVLEFIERVKAYRYTLDPNLPHGYNHLDIDFDGNVLTQDGKVSGIVDFDDLSYSPMVVCLGFSLWNILDDEGPDAMKFYLSEYEKIRPISDLERDALPHIIFFRNYVIGIVRLMLWQQDTPTEDIYNLIRLEEEIPKIVL